MNSRRLGDVLGGLGVATWLFLPIAVSSLDGPMTMMWELSHTVSLLLAWVLVAAISVGALAVIRSTRAVWQRGIALAVVSFSPGVTVLNLLVRNLTARDPDTPTRIGAPVLVVGILGLGCVAWFVFRRGWASAGPTARHFLTASSVLLVPFWIGVARLPVSGRRASRIPLGSQRAVLPGAARCRDVNVVLLDELSYGAVFTNGQPSRPNIAPLVASARVYHQARSPAIKTLESVAGYLTGLPPTRISLQNGAPLYVRPDGSIGPLGEAVHERGLFLQAKRLGYRTEAFGWYFPYCEVLGDTVDTCRTVSMYNAGTLDEGVSVRAPFVTVANMWPYQWPSGLFKRPAAVSLHRASFDVLRTLAEEASGDGPVFRWVHYNVPHRPWLEGNGLIDAGAFENNPRRYESQLAEVDRAVTSFLDGVRAGGRFDDAVIVLTSDHGARQGLRKDDPRRVPLIVRSPSGLPRTDVSDPVDVEDVLQNVWSVACERR